MTLTCPPLRGALAALRFLAKHEGFEIVLIKNRLTLAFDASASGGSGRYVLRSRNADDEGVLGRLFARR